MSEYIVRIPSDMPYEIKAELYAWYVNSEPIVRCRDCKFYQPKEGAMLSCKFEYHGFTQWKLAEPDGFCAWGERVSE